MCVRACVSSCGVVWRVELCPCVRARMSSCCGVVFVRACVRACAHACVPLAGICPRLTDK